ncbi:MAG: hypothetical protein LBI60_02265 [Bacteroidales bacterium]|jgi:hypothetical protein|nr:hypothetical protein [Bacteroidales bacterium]
MEIEKLLNELEQRYGSVESVIAEIRSEGNTSSCEKCTGAAWGDDRCSNCKGSAGYGYGTH